MRFFKRLLALVLSIGMIGTVAPLTVRLRVKLATLTRRPHPSSTLRAGFSWARPEFVDRVRRMAGGRPEDQGLPLLRQLRPRPALEAIKVKVAAGFGVDLGNWSLGRRSDDAGRAVAAHLSCPASFRVFGCGGSKHPGVPRPRLRSASRPARGAPRVEHGTAQLQQTMKRLEKRPLTT